MSAWNAYREDVLFTFKKQKEAAEKAFAQLDADQFFRQPGAHSNSVAVIVKHVAGNLLSRWTDFLTSDGEKPWRDRDAEFVIAPPDSRANLMERWEQGWTTLRESLEILQECDWLKRVTIRGEEHTVLQAIQRSLTHTSYHVGQIVFLARLLKIDGWTWITIPPGQSRQHTKKYLQ
jgi:uncharacterized damage-inducible protein DinB